MLVVVGLLFVHVWGHSRLRPRTAAQGDSKFLSDYPQITASMIELTVDPASPLTGRSLADTSYFRQHAVRVIRIFRPQATVLDPGPHDTLRPADRLLVQGSRAAVLALCADHGLHPAEAPAGDGRLRTGAMRVVEAVIPPGSVLVGHTVRETRFRTRFGLTVLGVLRQGVTRAQILPDLGLQADVLAVQGHSEAIAGADLGHDLTVLADAEHHPTSGRRAALAVAIVAALLTVAAMNLLSLQAAAARTYHLRIPPEPAKPGPAAPAPRRIHRTSGRPPAAIRRSARAPFPTSARPSSTNAQQRRQTPTRRRAASARRDPWGCGCPAPGRRWPRARAKLEARML